MEALVFHNAAASYARTPNARGQARLTRTVCAGKRSIVAGEQFWELLKDQILEAQVTGPLATDAALAALALEHGATLCSVDRDFRRFRDLKLVDPTDQSERGP
jgi:predicted nucleic acid-binding protein